MKVGEGNGKKKEERLNYVSNWPVTSDFSVFIWDNVLFHFVDNISEKDVSTP